MRITAAVALALVVLGAAVPASAAPKPYAVTCTSLMREFPQALGGFKVSFERPLTITRDLFGSDDDGVDLHILSTDADVDGTLRCKGDEIRRFEVRIAAPPDAATQSNFVQFEQAALTSLFHWDKARAATVVTAMSSDADEYLRASIQREDTYNSGKVEYHQGGGYDLGVIWTPTERTLIIATQSDD